MHLCLSGCGGVLKVGGEEVRWTEFEPMVFDDSYLHSITLGHQRDDRLVLHIMVMHPQVGTRGGMRHRYILQSR